MFFFPFAVNGITLIVLFSRGLCGIKQCGLNEEIRNYQNRVHCTFSEHLVCVKLESERSNISVTTLAINRLKMKAHYEIISFQSFEYLSCTFKI